jgi:UDP-glucose 4-epimerase
VHFAGSIVVPESVADPLTYYHNNTCVSRNLIQACVEEGVRPFIFSSTAVVYGNPDKIPISEDAPTSPVSPYATSKLMTEYILRDTAAAHDFIYVAMRYFNVAGADPLGRSGQSTPNATHLIKAASQAAIGRRGYVEIFGQDYETPDGTCIRDYIHVTDLAKAHVAALRYIETGAGNLTVNCGYGHGYSVREVLQAVERETGARLELRSAPRRPGDTAILVADVRRICERLDWRPEHDDLGFIVRTAIEWERRLAAD